MDRLFSRDARLIALIAAVAAVLFAVGPAGDPSPLRAGVYAVAVGVGLFLFAREALGDGAALAASLVLLVAASQEWPGPVEMRRATMVVGSILFFLAADRSGHSRPQPGLLLGGWLFLGASLLPNGVAGTLVIPAVLAGHLLARPAAARVRFLKTPIHFAGIAVGGLALWGFLAAARPGTEVEFFTRSPTQWDRPDVTLGRFPVALIPFLPLAAAALVWAWRRARKQEAPFARTGLAWVVAAALVGTGCWWNGTPAATLPLMVPLAILAGAWLDLAAERNPLGSAARWGVGSACALAAVAGLAYIGHRDPPQMDGLFQFPNPVLTPAWVWVASGALMLAGAAAASVRLFLLAAPTRAVLDLVCAFAAAAAVLGLGRGCGY